MFFVCLLFVKLKENTVGTGWMLGDDGINLSLSVRLTAAPSNLSVFLLEVASC